MVRCTIYAQIYVLWEQDTIILLSPQWGSNSKAASIELAELYIMGFRPRNGEVNLKRKNIMKKLEEIRFSPRNGGRK